VLEEGRLTADPGARLPGRGAYVCLRQDGATSAGVGHGNPECMADAIRHHAFERSFRSPVRVPNDHLDWVR